MEYTKPNFEFEWEEAQRYPEFSELGKEGWIERANNNFEIDHYKRIKDVLGNVDFSDGNEAFGVDEGRVKTFEFIKQLKDEWENIKGVK